MDMTQTNDVQADERRRHSIAGEQADEQAGHIRQLADELAAKPLTDPAGYACACEHCGHQWRSDEQNPETCPRCGELGEHETE
jgi:rubrerythrin